jgi:hypothetical protein
MSIASHHIRTIVLYELLWNPPSQWWELFHSPRQDGQLGTLSQQRPFLSGGLEGISRKQTWDWDSILCISTSPLSKNWCSNPHCSRSSSEKLQFMQNLILSYTSHSLSTLHSCISVTSICSRRIGNSFLSAHMEQSCLFSLILLPRRNSSTQQQYSAIAILCLTHLTCWQTTQALLRENREEDWNILQQNCCSSYLSVVFVSD